jgi:Bacterial membrane protein YfhO
VWGFELLRARVSAGRLAIGGGAFALVALAGHSQMVFLTAVVLAVYAAVLALTASQDRWRPLVLASALLAVGGGLAAVQLLPTATILHATDRAKLDYAAATTYSLPASHTPLLVFPYLFGGRSPTGHTSGGYHGAWELRELSGYVGAAALVLAAAGLAGAQRDKRVVAFLAVAGVCLVMALGRSSPVGRLVYALPVAGQFRAWGRYLAGVDLAVAMLAGYGIAALRTATSARRARHAAIGAAAAIALGALVVPHVGPVAAHYPDPASVLWPSVAAALAAALAVLVGRAPRIALRALTAVVTLDLVLSFGAFTEWRTMSPDRTTVDWGLTFVRNPPDAPGGIDRYVDLSQRSSATRDEVDIAATNGSRSVNGFDPLAPRDYLEAAGDMSYFGLVTSPAAFTRPQSHLLDLLRVSVVLDDDPADRVVPRRWQREPALPESFVVGAAARVSRAHALDAIQGVVPFDPRATALVEAPCRRCSAARTPGPAGTSDVTRRQASRRTVDVRADRAAMVVVSEAWFPGWHATVDGRAAPVVRIDGIVQGVPVTAGHHTVELRYLPPGLHAGALVSALTLAALAIGGVVSRRRSSPTG